MRKNADQNNSEYEHFLRSASFEKDIIMDGKLYRLPEVSEAVLILASAWILIYEYIIHVCLTDI